MVRLMRLAWLWLVVVPPTFAELPPGPVPPDSWETRVIPGFEPSIESVLVQYPYPSADVLRRSAESWGPEAAPALIRLYEDSRWAAFRPTIIGLLTYVQGQEARAWLMAKFKALVSSGELPDESRLEVYPVAHALAERGGDEVFDLLAEQAKNGEGPFRYAAISALSTMGGEKVLELFRTMAVRMGNEGKAGGLDFYIQQLEGRTRAREPMSNILEREQKHTTEKPSPPQ